MALDVRMIQGSHWLDSPVIEWVIALRALSGSSLAAYLGKTKNREDLQLAYSGCIRLYKSSGFCRWGGPEVNEGPMGEPRALGRSMPRPSQLPVPMQLRDWFFRLVL
jgi:hypothetical protein